MQADEWVSSVLVSSARVDVLSVCVFPVDVEHRARLNYRNASSTLPVLLDKHRSLGTKNNNKTHPAKNAERNQAQAIFAISITIGIRETLETQYDESRDQLARRFERSRMYMCIYLYPMTINRSSLEMHRMPAEEKTRSSSALTLRE